MSPNALALALALSNEDHIAARLVDCGCTAALAEECERARPVAHCVPMFEEWSDPERACPCRCHEVRR